MAQDAERARGVVEAGGNLVGGELFDEIGAESFVLAVERVLGGEEESSRSCYLFTMTGRHNYMLLQKQYAVNMFFAAPRRVSARMGGTWGCCGG
jgi:hypothetical protein